MCSLRLTCERWMRLAAVIASIAPGAAAAQSFTLQLFPIATATVTSEQFLMGSKDGAPATIAAELRTPGTGTEKLAAVVIVHGGVGAGHHEDNWARELNSIGIATLIVDSFAGRSVADTRANLAQLSSLATLGDSFRALDLLARHPRIDPARIAILGFSRGAVAAVYASNRRFHKFHGTEGLTFAAHVGFYTPCGTRFIDDEDVTDKPVRLFHGVSDDWVPIEHCRDYVARLRKAGKDVTLTEYPEAHHRFDDLALQSPVKLAQAQTLRRCLLQEQPAGKYINRETGQPFAASDPCVERGVTVALNRAAQQSAMQSVKEFLAGVLK
jgi:dienelactone hydrolase